MDRIVITGGNSGMGRETVEQFLKLGHKVMFTSRSTKTSEEVMNELSKYVQSGNLFFFRCDSSNANDVISLVVEADKIMGGCDVLVNCAAIFTGGELHETSEEDFDNLMNINVKGYYLTSKYFLPQMLKRGKGNIINISSLCGIRGAYNCPIYAASKSAVNNMTRSMALDYMERGVRVNAICPSATATKMFLNGSSEEVIAGFNKQNPAGRISSPEEIAELIIFLASDKAKFINGQTISIDGGLSAWNGEIRQDKEK